MFPLEVKKLCWLFRTYVARYKQKVRNVAYKPRRQRIVTSIKHYGLVGGLINHGLRKRAFRKKEGDTGHKWEHQGFTGRTGGGPIVKLKRPDGTIRIRVRGPDKRLLCYSSEWVTVRLNLLHNIFLSELSRKRKREQEVAQLKFGVAKNESCLF